MHNTFLIIEIILGALIAGSILLQAQGTGLGSSWSGGGETYHTRRGVEKVVFYFTIIATLLFALNSIAILIS
ncbi:MAG: preprotein translocase subunit SecG [Patescibacteria group bacterium]